MRIKTMNIFLKRFLVLITCGIITAHSSAVYGQTGPKTPSIFAYRGLASVLPGNTLPAIEGAYGLRFGAVIRVHKTKDSKMVVFHERFIDSPEKGMRLINSLLFSEVKIYDTGSWFDIKFKGLEIPTFEQVLISTANNLFLDIQLIIEYQKGYSDMIKDLIKAIEKYNLTEKVILFDVPQENTLYLKELGSNVKSGFSVLDKIAFNEALYKAEYDYIFAIISDNQWLGPEDMKNASAKNKKVFAVLIKPEQSTEKKIKMAVQLNEMNVYGIITDIPVLIYKMMREVAYKDILAQKRKREERRKKPKKQEYQAGRMVLIPAGYFFMGSHSREGYTEERPYHCAYLDEYYIDMYEVAIMEYVDFLNAGGNDKHYHKSMQEIDYCGIIKRKDGKYAVTPGREDYPVTCVTWEDAAAYAAWAGKRLPTEAEWEKAARGGLAGKRFPNYSSISHSQVNYMGVRGKDVWEYNSPPGAFPANGYGLFDMSGNVWEWVHDYFHPKYYIIADTVYNPVNTKSGKYRIIRGGSFADVYELDSYLRVSARGPNYPIPERWGNRIGFRCARTPENLKKKTRENSIDQEETMVNSCAIQ